MYLNSIRGFNQYTIPFHPYINVFISVKNLVTKLVGIS